MWCDAAKTFRSWCRSRWGTRRRTCEQLATWQPEAKIPSEKRKPIRVALWNPNEHLTTTTTKNSLRSNASSAREFERAASAFWNRNTTRMQICSLFINKHEALTNMRLVKYLKNFLSMAVLVLARWSLALLLTSWSLLRRFDRLHMLCLVVRLTKIYATKTELGEFSLLFVP